MSFDEFVESVSSGTAPAGLSGALVALWWDKKGDWERAHEEAQSAGSREGDWVHAYLHRKEGDEGNAGYWYSRSREPFFEGTLDAEWEAIAKALL
ncbi:hypothetical protein [Pelagicoccus mobilis]|uniref:Uncharacterized protein n=1 Tax=Pelagicoccus mobilis TaxID=415221 RepID=A0A934S2K1_9BACT|nr:hypothetical protein [Pelagicoccus mobilis]MBK1877893.1 hypothetical protein [Pelagicoccus mobilis]